MAISVKDLGLETYTSILLIYFFTRRDDVEKIYIREKDHILIQYTPLTMGQKTQKFWWGAGDGYRYRATS